MSEEKKQEEQKKRLSYVELQNEYKKLQKEFDRAKTIITLSTVMNDDLMEMLEKVTDKYNKQVRSLAITHFTFAAIVIIPLIVSLFL